MPTLRMPNLINGNSLEVLKTFETNSIDAVVTDPPYGISFMGKGWDKVLPPTEIWQECFRVLKPGGYILAMSASRTFHRLAVDLEDIGFIVHPMIGWIYGSGFPKATDLSKQFDKAAGVEREVVGRKQYADGTSARTTSKYAENSYHASKTRGDSNSITAPSTDNAKKYNGFKYGLQSLKPALEPIFMGQKPHLKPMIKNVEKWGTGAVNIDACRVESGMVKSPQKDTTAWHGNQWSANPQKSNGEVREFSGRHPANLLHDGSEEVEREFLEQGGISKSAPQKRKPRQVYQGNSLLESKTMNAAGDKEGGGNFSDEGSVSRFFNKLPHECECNEAPHIYPNGDEEHESFCPFFYTAKASKSERNRGLDEFREKQVKFFTNSNHSGDKRYDGNNIPKYKNHHPTVKPIKLMEWMVKLVTPIGGTVLDPFMGSGSTGVAAKKNNYNFVGIELSKEYFEISKARINGKS